MRKHRKVVELFADHVGVRIVRVLEDELYEVIVGVQHKRYLGLELVHADSHAVHLHHILHTAVFFGKRDDRSHTGVLQLVDLHVELVVRKHAAEQRGQRIGLALQLIRIGLLFECLGDVRINTHELAGVIVLLKLRDERLIDVVCHNQRVHAGLLEHVDVLALLTLVGHVVNNLLGRFLLLLGIGNRGIGRLVRIRLVLRSLRCCSLFKIFRKRDVLALEVLIDDEVLHLVAELHVLQAAELDERTDVIPTLFVGLALGLVHAGQFVGNLLCDVIADLLNETVVLQGAARHI